MEDLLNGFLKNEIRKLSPGELVGPPSWPDFYCPVTQKPQHAFNHPGVLPIGISARKQDFTYHKQDGATCGPFSQPQPMALNQKM